MKLFSRFPSLDHLYDNATAAFARFPFTLISAIIAAISGVVLIEAQGGDEFNYVEKVMIVCSLGLPLFTVLGCLAEKIGWNKQKNLLIQFIAALLLTGYYFTLPPDIDDPFYHLQRFLLLNIAFHFLVAFLPYLRGQQVKGFWQYNKSLFLRFLTAVLYSGVLYLGLIMAMAALDYLFGVEIDEESYFELWIVCAGIVNTWIFLAGIPQNLENLNSISDYPKGLKVFTQYILLPLVGLYFVILIAYEAKIIITWTWPKGWVSQMVLWYAVVGILSLLLLHPLREQSGNKWIQVFSKWFFRGLIPLVVMLFLAILARIADYGITENRYYVLAMAVGLAVVVLYFVFSKAKDIRLIPIVICVIALLSAYGPWSAFSVSKQSQQKRIEKFMAENGMLVDAKFVKAAERIPVKTEREMSNIIEYLSETHGAASFSKWFPDSVINSLDTVDRYSRPLQIAKVIGIEYLPYYQGADDQQYFDFTPKEREIIKLEGYDYLIDLGSYNIGDIDQKFPLDDDSVHVIYNDSTYNFTFQYIDSKISSLRDSVLYSLSGPVNALVDKWRTGNVEQKELIFDIAGKKFDARLIIKQVSGYKKEKEIIVNLLSADILLRTH